MSRESVKRNNDRIKKVDREHLKCPPRTTLAGKKVPKPMTELKIAADIVRAHAALKKFAPHLLAPEPQVSPVANNEVKITIPKWEDQLVAAAEDALINRPSHYQGNNGIECIEAQEAATSNSPLNGFEAHLLATITGYAFRCGKKDDALRDARKLQWYANKLVETLEKDNEPAVTRKTK